MKNLLLALVFLSASISISLINTSVHAADYASIDRTPVIAKISGALEGLSSVFLMADGRLFLVDSTGGRVVTRLGPAAMRILTPAVDSLKGITVTESKSLFVCEMMKAPDLSNLEVDGRLILTAQDCTVSHRVLPTEEVHAQAASELRAQLKILALSKLK